MILGERYQSGLTMMLLLHGHRTEPAISITRTAHPPSFSLALVHTNESTTSLLSPIAALSGTSGTMHVR